MNYMDGLIFIIIIIINTWNCQKQLIKDHKVNKVHSLSSVVHEAWGQSLSTLFSIFYFA